MTDPAIIVIFAKSAREATKLLRTKYSDAEVLQARRVAMPQWELIYRSEEEENERD